MLSTYSQTFHQKHISTGPAHSHLDTARALVGETEVSQRCVPYAIVTKIIMILVPLTGHLESSPHRMIHNDKICGDHRPSVKHPHTYVLSLSCPPFDPALRSNTSYNLLPLLALIIVPNLIAATPRNALSQFSRCEIQYSPSFDMELACSHILPDHISAHIAIRSPIFLETCDSQRTL